jgi:hypothetical protein
MRGVVDPLSGNYRLIAKYRLNSLPPASSEEFGQMGLLYHYVVEAGIGPQPMQLCARDYQNRDLDSPRDLHAPENKKMVSKDS